MNSKYLLHENLVSTIICRYRCGGCHARATKYPGTTATAGVPRTLLQSRTKSTVQKYTRSFDRWKKWAAQYPEISKFPALPAHVALYLQHLLETSEAKTAVDDAVNALAWAHELGGLPSPTSHPTVRAMQESAHRIKGRPKLKKEPASPQLLQKMVRALAQESASLLDIRTVTICLLAFSGFFWFNEIAQIRCSDLQFSSTDVRIKVQQSKTVQYRDGNEVIIGRTGNVTCPVAMLERYMTMANLKPAGKTGCLDLSQQLSKAIG